MTRFINKTVVVTGAASGIGAAVAKKFSDEGANVVALDLDQAKTEQAIKDFPPDRALALKCDTSKSEDAITAIRAAVDRFGGIDVLINNAGVLIPGDVTTISDDNWDKTLAVNVTGYYRMAKAALPELKKTKGCIVQTSSVLGLSADSGLVAYNTSKGAVSNMTRSMAIDYGPDGIRVNAVNPTFTETGMTKGVPSMVAKFVERIPMRRVGQADDIANVMVFLASEEAGFVTGVNLPVDGGLTAATGQPSM